MLAERCGRTEAEKALFEDNELPRITVGAPGTVTTTRWRIWCVRSCSTWGAWTPWTLGLPPPTRTASTLTMDFTATDAYGQTVLLTAFGQAELLWIE